MIQPFVHALADVQTTAIGAGTRIWQFVVVLPGARIGDDCNICSHCLIENDVLIGDRVTVKSGVQLWDGLRMGDDVFVGPNASFANDRFPRGEKYTQHFAETIVVASPSIGEGGAASWHNDWDSRDGARGGCHRRRHRSARRRVFGVRP